MATGRDFFNGLASPTSRLRYAIARGAERLSRRASSAATKGISGKLVMDGTTYELRRGTADWLVASHLHEKETHAWIDETFPMGGHGVMIDAGGFSGSFSLRHRRRFDRIVAFEPFPSSYAAFSRNIELNEATNITLIQAAVGHSAGNGQLVLGTSFDRHSLIGEGNGIAVRVTTLDDEIPSDEDALVRLIKVDVEGAEIDVLRGAGRVLRAGSPFIVLEANNPPHMRCLIAHLTPLGYSLHAVLDRRNFIFEKSQRHAG